MDAPTSLAMGFYVWAYVREKRRRLRAELGRNEILMVAGHLCGFDRELLLAAIRKRAGQVGIKLPAEWPPVMN